MAETRPLMSPEQLVPVLSDDDVRRLLADCSGKDFRNRRDLAILRLFLDTGMRLEGMAGLRYSADDRDASARLLVAALRAAGVTVPVRAGGAAVVGLEHARALGANAWTGTDGRSVLAAVEQIATRARSPKAESQVGRLPLVPR